MLPQLLEQIAKNWADFNIMPGPPTKLAAVCQTFGFDKAAALIYADSHGTPALVAKLPRAPKQGRQDQRPNDLGETELDEQERLRAVYMRVPVDLRSTLPRPLGKVQAGGSEVALESYLSGQPMNGTFHGQDLRASRSLDRYVVSVSRWLIDFQCRVPSVQIPVERREAWLTAPIRRYQAAFDLEVAEHNFLARLVAEIQSGAFDAVTPVVSHGQLGPENVLLDGETVRVIDWEWANLAGIPGADLLRFLMLYFFRTKNLEQSIETTDAYTSAFHWLWWEEGTHRAFVDRLVGDYFKALAVTPSFARCALALALIEEAVSKVRALQARIERGGYWYPLGGTSFQPYHRHVQQQLNRVLLRTLAEGYEAVCLCG